MKTLYHFGAEGGLRYVLAEFLDDVVVNVCFQQGLADLAHGVRYVRLGNSAPAGKRPKDRVKFFS
jgi:hypothetical protein